MLWVRLCPNLTVRPALHILSRRDIYKEEFTIPRLGVRQCGDLS